MIDALRTFLNDQFPDDIIRESVFRDQHSWLIRPDSILRICEALHNDPVLDVTMLSDVVSVDWYGNDSDLQGRFEVIYNLYSIKNKYRFFLRAFLPSDKPEIPSLTPLWQGANWLEREAWDMMGIVFAGHPELTKILTADELEGHPLRRDFPLTYETPVFSWNKDDPPEVIK